MAISWEASPILALLGFMGIDFCHRHCIWTKGFAKDVKAARKPASNREHMQFTSAAQQVVDNDACALVAVESLQEYLMSKMSDPSDLDMLNISNILIARPKKAYSINASINHNKVAKKYEVSVTCTGKVDSEN